MPETSLDDTLKNIDARLTRIEQVLPTLATREEVKQVIVPLATREELHAAIAAAVAPLATREELHVAIAAAIEPLATREELHAEGEQSRRHATMLIEDLREDNRIILENLLALSERVDALARR